MSIKTCMSTWLYGRMVVRGSGAGGETVMCGKNQLSRGFRPGRRARPLFFPWSSCSSCLFSRFVVFLANPAKGVHLLLLRYVSSMLMPANVCTRMSVFVSVSLFALSLPLLLSLCSLCLQSAMHLPAASDLLACAFLLSVFFCLFSASGGLDFFSVSFVVCYLFFCGGRTREQGRRKSSGLLGKSFVQLEHRCQTRVRKEVPSPFPPSFFRSYSKLLA